MQVRYCLSIVRLAMLLVLLSLALTSSKIAYAVTPFPTPIPQTLTNSDFESGNFTGWVTRSSESSVYSVVTTPNTSTATAPPAGKCARMFVDGSSSSTSQAAVYVSNRDLPLNEGSKAMYRGTVWMKTDLTQGTAGPYVVATKTGTPANVMVNFGQKGIASLSGKTGWTLITFTYILDNPKITEESETYKYTQAAVQFQASNARGTIWVDDFRLEKLEIGPTGNGNFGFEESGASATDWTPWVRFQPTPVPSLTPAPDDSDVYEIATGTNIFPEGSRAAHFKTKNANSSGIRGEARVLRSDLPKAFGYYRLTYWMKTKLFQGHAGAEIVVNFPQPTPTPGVTPTPIPSDFFSPGKEGRPLATGTTEWSQYSFVYRVGPQGATGNATNVNLKLVARSTRPTVVPTPGGTPPPSGEQYSDAWFDNVIVEKVPNDEGAAAYAQQMQVAPDFASAYPSATPVQPVLTVNPLAGCLYDAIAGTATHHMLALNSCVGPQGAAILIDYDRGGAPHLIKSVPFDTPAGRCVIPIAGATSNTGKLLYDAITDQGKPLSVVEINKGSTSIAHEADVTAPPLSVATSYAYQMVPNNSETYVYFGCLTSSTAYAFRYNLSTQSVDQVIPIDSGNSQIYRIGLTGDNQLLCSINGVGTKWKDLTTGQSGKAKVWVRNSSGVIESNDLNYGVPLVTIYTKGQASSQKVYAAGIPDPNDDNIKKLHVYDSATHQFNVADFGQLPPTNGVPDPNKWWTDIVPGCKPDNLILMASDLNYYQVLPGSAPKLIFDGSFIHSSTKDGTLLGLDAGGNVVGILGQKYFVGPSMISNPGLTIGEFESEYLYTINPVLSEDADEASTAPPATGAMFLRAGVTEGGQGVTGGGPFGNTLFQYDPSATPSIWNSDQVMKQNGEVYDGRWCDEKFYFACYAYGQIGVWDPGLAWNQYGSSGTPNPQHLTSVVKVTGDTATFNGVRPLGGVAINNVTKKMYVGWSGTYDGNSGGITEFDINSSSPTTALRYRTGSTLDTAGQEVSIESVILGPGPNAASTNAGEAYVYGVTSNDFNGTGSFGPRPQTLFIIDPDQTETGVGNNFGKVIDRIPLGTSAGAACFYVPYTGSTVQEPKTGRVWVALPDGLRPVVKVATNDYELGALLPWPAGCPSLAYNNVRVGPRDSIVNRAWLTLTPSGKTGTGLVNTGPGVVIKLYDDGTPGPWMEVLFQKDDIALARPEIATGLAANTNSGDQNLYTFYGRNLFRLPLGP